MSLQNKVILITGSTTGIGEATARLCVEQGAQVMIHGRRADAAQALVEELGANSACVVGDLADPALCQRIVAETVAHFGALHGLVNNAALTTRSTLENTDAAIFDRIVGVNLRAPLLVIRAAAPIFRQQGGGAVVNIGSVNALGGQPDLLAYSAAKGGLATMTRNLANALATELIRVNQLNVGWVTTPNEIALKQTEGLAPGWENNVPKIFAPTGRLLTPQQVARHIAFWLSDVSAPANGVVYELEQYSHIGRNPYKEF
ncbi:MAG: SDR family oxidoreductase [Caldilineaceae bacterium]|nr:SDR family oxidoreductase [Caldilineaceae bacterium]